MQNKNTPSGLTPKGINEAPSALQVAEEQSDERTVRGQAQGG